jgi:ABC-type sugar transport system ATPase subunit
MTGSGHQAASPSPAPAGDTPLGALRGVSKRYPGVLALDAVDLEIRRNEIHALVGLNGAGKSTLVKILAGAVRPNRGEVLINGNAVSMRGPWDARRRGVVLVPQEVISNPSLSPGRNAMLGAERFWVRRDRLSEEERRRVAEAFELLGASFGEARSVEQLSVPERRALQIAAGLVREGTLLVLDEPTAVLSDSDAAILTSRLADLRRQGQGIVYVSHRLGEVLETADRVTVLRDGQQVATLEAEGLDRERLIALMSGSDRRARTAREDPTALVAETEAGKGDADAAEPLLRVRGLRAGAQVNNIDLDVAPGQVVALVGVKGAGQDRVLHTIAGLDESQGGQVMVAGRPLERSTVEARYRAGLVLLPADRRRAGIVASLDLQENIALPPRSRARRLGWRILRRERKIAGGYRRDFGIKAASIRARAGTLSGGNQQKLALARAIECRPVVLLLEEPTQGIDVHGKAEVARLIRELVRHDQRSAVIATSEIEEVLDLADVVYVMRRGRISAKLDPGEATRGEVLEHAL